MDIALTTYSADCNQEIGSQYRNSNFVSHFTFFVFRLALVIGQ